MAPAWCDPPGVYLVTFAYSLVGGVVPVFNVEVYLLSLPAWAPDAGLVPTAVAAALGQVAAKAILYLCGRGLLRLPVGAHADRVKAASERLRRRPAAGMTAVLASSAVAGVPPIYAVSVAAGLLRLPMLPFLAIALTGRTIRFVGLLLLPYAAAALW